MKFVLFALSLSASSFAFADNTLTSDQLVKAVQKSLADYATLEPEMSRSISGLKVVTVGSQAQVSLDMNTDGMHMSAKYLCALQAEEMNCRFQQ